MNQGVMVDGRRLSVEDDVHGIQPSMEDNLRWKTTFGGRPPSMEDYLQWKTAFNGRRPSMEDDLQWKTTFGGRRSSVEDDFTKYIISTWLVANQN